ncbi:MAG TPA: DUF1801 domain-containing protein [Steroidobacteraceae bacterium]|jgi:hypothetical protein|nr:DUF1801 domain-containing protein [Steroidobacteraceae bacterium]
MTPQAQLDRFIDKFSPDVAKLGRAAIARMRKFLPAAQVLVYDNYNALAVGFGPTDRSTDIVFSIAFYPRWVSLFFAKGVGLPDPHKRLQGSGNVVRHVVLTEISVLDDPQIRELMQQARARSGASLQTGKRGPIVIKSISARQRPRRTPTKTKARSRS